MSQQLSWEKSSFCQGGECVEAAADGDTVLLRNSTRPRVAASLSPEAFRDLVLGIKAGEFDWLAGS